MLDGIMLGICKGDSVGSIVFFIRVGGALGCSVGVSADIVVDFVRNKYVLIKEYLFYRSFD